MKSAGTVRHKIQQVRYRYLKHLIKSEMRRCPANCRFNGTLPLPSGEHLGICTFGGWEPRVCDPAHGGDGQARDCTVFTPRRTKAEIKEAFRADLESMSLAEIAANYPDLAALVWVLDPEDLPATQESDLDTEEVEVEVEPDETPRPEVAGSPPVPSPGKGSWLARLIGML